MLCGVIGSNDLCTVYIYNDSNTKYLNSPIKLMILCEIMYIKKHITAMIRRIEYDLFIKSYNNLSFVYLKARTITVYEV